MLYLSIVMCCEYSELHPFSDSTGVLAVLTDKELDEQLEYEMDDEDLDWLTNKLPEQKVQMKEDKFEQIIDRLEKESFKQVGVILLLNLPTVCPISTCDPHSLLFSLLAC